MRCSKRTIQNAGLAATRVTRLTVAALLLSAGPVLAATYYVDQSNPQASDANSGTQTSPWLTITKAAQTAVAGDTVLVKAGRYADPASTWENAFNPANSGVQGAPIVFRSEPRLAAVVAPGDYPSNHTEAWGVEGRSYIVIDGFKAEGQIRMMACTNVTFQNCEVITGSIEGSDTSLNWGMTIHTSTYGLVRNNYVHNMRDSGNNTHNTAGIMVFQSNNSTIENNDVDCGGGIVYSGYGQKGGLITFNVWRRNIARNGQAGFLGMGSTDATKLSTDNQFYENIILNCTEGAFLLDHGTKRFDIYNNTAYNTRALVWANYTDSDNTDMRLWNNLIAAGDVGYHRETGSSVDWHVLLASSDYNNYSTPKVASWNWGNSSYTTLADWRQAVALDGHSLAVDPSFLNAANGDFHLNTSSPCRQAGLNGVDLGAYPTGTETIGPDYSIQSSSDVIPPSAITDLRAR